MLSSKIRKEFLHYFKNNHHKIVASSPVIPHDDPTLLFVNAGMNQFKDVFLGQSYREYRRATTSQKCIRVGGKHNDLDNVGHTSRHMTFFEMLGNFSFGDYFKEDAIKCAWEVTLNVFGFDPEYIWASVFEEDDEAFEMWKAYLPEKRIIRLGKKDNFWMMGETGPCGPCSELLYDRGSKFSQATKPQDDPTGERFLEFWNLVFMQYNAQADGKMTHLPNKSVDTGAGLERVVSLIEGVDSVFEIDIFRELTAQIEQTLNVKYRKEEATLAPAFYVIADHLRSLSFAIADGAQPSNTDRGYVLRKLVRRAVRYGRLLGADKPFLAKVFPRLQALMGQDYHELAQASSRICEILTEEEEGFLRTLKRGGNILSSVIEKTQTSAHKEISGEDAFKLKDTYGFPLEEIMLIAKDSHLTVNLDSFSLLEQQAKERSKKAKEVHLQEVSSSDFAKLAETYGQTPFIGYGATTSETTLLAIIKDGKQVECLNAQDSALILLEQTPFYAEKGGQVGDTGKIFHQGGEFLVEQTLSPLPGLTLHKGTLIAGNLISGEPVTAQVDEQRRRLIENNHSATHLLHWALQRVLGEHIKQAGSLVEPHKLRFDFTHHKTITKEELREIERLINHKIRHNGAIESYELSYEDAQKSQDIKQFFGEKYGLVVRVVDMDGFSKELCGGTHAASLGQLGLFKIAKESSIAKGVRRIEAFTGAEAEKLVCILEDHLLEIETLLQAPQATVCHKLKHLIEENQHLKMQAKKLRAQELQKLAEALVHKKKTLHTHAFICAKIDVSSEELFAFAQQITSLSKDLTALLAIEHEGRCQLLLKLADSLAAQGVSATAMMKEIAVCIQGSGGGKGNSAQAGGAFPQGIPAAFEQFEKMLGELC
jgi:alanyl-tRNA synthetase